VFLWRWNVRTVVRIRIRCCYRRRWTAQLQRGIAGNRREGTANPWKPGRKILGTRVVARFIGTKHGERDDQRNCSPSSADNQRRAEAEKECGASQRWMGSKAPFLRGGTPRSGQAAIEGGSRPPRAKVKDELPKKTLGAADWFGQHLHGPLKLGRQLPEHASFRSAVIGWGNVSA